MKYYHRAILPFLEQTLLNFPVVILTGARQTGKSTLVQTELKTEQRIFKTLDDFTLLELAERDPETLLSGSLPIILDEVQRAPQLLLAIKKRVDEHRVAGQFLLTGSANLLMMRKVSETLAGRATYITLRPLTMLEIGERVSSIWPLLAESQNSKDCLQALFEFGRKITPVPIVDAILQGGYPLIIQNSSPIFRLQWFDGYIRTYLERDLQTQAEIANLADFRRFMRFTAHRVGKLLNQAELARDAGLSMATAHRYLNLLETTYQIERIPAYAVNRTKRLIKAPKLFWGDTGLGCFLCGFQDSLTFERTDYRGAWVENWVLRQMDVWREITLPKPEIFYWRTVSGEEVDFVITCANETLIPLEVKLAKAITAADLKGLRAFLAEYADTTRFGIIFYAGDRVQQVDKQVIAIPLQYLVGFDGS